MKIIQLLARVEGNGVTRYVIELNKGLKNLGHDVEIIYVKANDKSEMYAKKQNIDGIVEYDYSEETINHINSADLLIVNSIMSKKANPKYKEAWKDMLINKIHIKKIIMINDHKYAGFNAYYGPLYKESEMWLAFDHIVTFSKESEVSIMIRKYIGDEEFNKRFLHLINPYEYDDTHSHWTPFKDKKRRISYFGSQSLIKDPMRLLRGREHFYAHDYELEYHGIQRTINMASQPDLLYSWDENGNKGPSKACIWADDKKWRLANGIDPNDLMIDTPRQKNWIYIFGEYVRTDGLMMMSKNAFGCNFFNLKNPLCTGDILEYSIHEIIDMGTIPLLDYDTGKHTYIYENGVRTNKTILDEGAGIFIKKDLSNIEECLNQMDDIMSSEEKYNNFRIHCFNIYKECVKPIYIAGKLLKEIFN